MEATNNISQMLVRAIALHQGGNIQDAETLYHAILESDPENADALRLLGVAQLQRGNKNEGVRLTRLSLTLNPHQAIAYNSLGQALHEMRQYDEALANYDKAIALNSNYAEAYYNRGITLQELKQYEHALASYDTAIARNPDYAEAHNNRGSTLYEMKRYKEALASYDNAIAQSPDYVDAYYNRGLTLQELKQYEDALANYDNAIALRPDYVKAHNNRGNALRELKRYEDALASYDHAIALNPDYVKAHNNRGIILQELKQYENALASYDRAIALRPDYAEVYSNRGVPLQGLRRYNEALANYDKAIALRPDYADAHIKRGDILRELERYGDAIASFNKAIALKTDTPYLLGTLLHTRMSFSDWHGINTVLDLLENELEAGKPVSFPLAIIATALSLSQQRKCAEIHIKHTFPPKLARLWNGERYSHAKIRVAYVSADFNEHPISYLTAGLFEKHDKTRFELYGISLAPEDKSPIGQRIKTAFDRFIDASQKSDKDVAQILRDLEIDIAVDLMGFTKSSRTNIFAYRAAPVQINYLGYPATMGADYIDYIIADAFVIPPQSRMNYAEKVVYLPDCFQANDDKRAISKEKLSRTKYNLPENGFIFCAFNNTYKITPVFFDIWMRLLKAVPDSVLWLLGDDAVQNNLRTEAGNRGVESSRLVFATRMRYEEHLARLRNADLFLDTLPFNAGATASDALWMGVPLLTCVGQAFAARMAGSLLMAAGLPELITDNLGDYEARALELATHPRKLASLRKKTIRNRATCALFNTDVFTTHMESAYIKMWEKYQAGMLPDDIRVGK